MSDIWDKSAEIRKKQIETDTDITFCKIFIPYFEQVAFNLNPKSIIEVGCGTGHLAKKLAKNGREIIAVEPSESMFKIACETLKGTSVKIHKCLIENYPSPREFDLILSHMCVQTVSDLNGFFSSISDLLSKDSIFIFSIPHPCFYNNYKGFFSKEEYQYIMPQSKIISFSITKDKDQLIKGIPYNHRPIEQYIKALKTSGMCLTDLDEIHPSNSIQSLYGELWKEPRYLVFYATLTPKMVEIDYEY